MTPESQAILDIFMSIKPELWWTLAQLAFVLLIAIIFKKGLTTYAAYIIFKWNKELGKNVKVVYEGKECIIMDYNYRYIQMKVLDGGNKIILPMIDSGGMKWEIIREADRERK
jgi:hypothetical protein